MSQRTQLDQALQSKALFWGFVGVIGLVAAYNIWGTDNLFPKMEQKADEVKQKAKDLKSRAEQEYNSSSSSSSTTRSTTQSSSAKTPAVSVELHGDPESWAEEDMEAWLKSHKVMVTGHEGKHELLAMVESTMHAPGFSG